MGATNFVRLRDWVEPAHPALVRMYDDILEIYRLIRKELQAEIDRSFHQASARIGYVVAATIPVTAEVAKEKVSWSIGADHLKGTLFEESLLPAFAKIQKLPVAPGTYKIYAVWTDALKLKLRKDWVEPAHYRIPNLVDRLRGFAQDVTAVPPEVHEPAHWFDPGFMLSINDAVLISVIDEVYPELRLADRVAFNREAIRRRVFPDVMEPAHFRIQDILKQAQK